MSNILSEVHPELVAEWSDKNLPLTPDRITYGSNKVVGETDVAAAGRNVHQENAAGTA